jgi:hypothetical protein
VIRLRRRHATTVAPGSASTAGLVGTSDATAIRQFLSAVHQALDLPAPERARDQLAYLTALEQRVRMARASIGRLIAGPGSDALDYASEGDRILHQLADLPPRTYGHHGREH